MIPPLEDHKIQAIRQRFFSDPKRVLCLAKGDILLEHKKPNDKLFLVLSGQLTGSFIDANGTHHNLFTAKTHRFIGVHSFFSDSSMSTATVIANIPCKIAWMFHPATLTPEEKTQFYESFLPVIVHELYYRQSQTETMALQKQQAYSKLKSQQKTALLGNLAAGIAHELNNAVSVFQSNVNWLITYYHHTLSTHSPDVYPFFAEVLTQGRKISSSETRKQSKVFVEKLGLPPKKAKQLAQMGVSVEQLAAINKKGIDWNKTSEVWELGATCHDMLIAAAQSIHVVKSVKTLGAKHSNREPHQSVNESIESALTLLRNKTKKLTVEVDLSPLPGLLANQGELVQIWVNLIKNAAESITQAGTKGGLIQVRSAQDWNQVIVEVTDNGPGIPKSLLPHIFQPDVTTKVHGLSFGLGLGLTYVQTLVEDYGGSIEIASSPQKTTFTVKIPFGGNHANT